VLKSIALLLLVLPTACARGGADTPPDAGADGTSVVEVRFKVPNPGYRVEIADVYAEADRLAVLAQVTPPPDRVAPMVIS